METVTLNQSNLAASGNDLAVTKQSASIPIAKDQDDIQHSILGVIRPKSDNESGTWLS